MSWRLRYRAGTHSAAKYPTIRYPWRTRPGCPTRERAEQIRAAMPDPEAFEIYEED